MIAIFTRFVNTVLEISDTKINAEANEKYNGGTQIQTIRYAERLLIIRQPSSKNFEVH